MGDIDLDVASCVEAQKTVRAREFYTIDDSALDRPAWCGRVWMNPPYSRIISEFADKLVESYEDGFLTEAITLTNNGTDTKWFQKMASVSTSICLPSGRIGFLKNGKPTENNNKGQVFLYFGDNQDRFEAEFSQYGVVYVR